MCACRHAFAVAHVWRLEGTLGVDPCLASCLRHSPSLSVPVYTHHLDRPQTSGEGGQPSCIWLLYCHDNTAIPGMCCLIWFKGFVVWSSDLYDKCFYPPSHLVSPDHPLSQNPCSLLQVGTGLLDPACPQLRFLADNVICIRQTDWAMKMMFLRLSNLDMSCLMSDCVANVWDPGSF